MPDESTDPSQSIPPTIEPATPVTPPPAISVQPSWSSSASSSTPKTPNVVSETFGDVTLDTKTGYAAMCYPNEDGASEYTHVELGLHFGDGNPVTPATLGLDYFEPFFTSAGLGAFVAQEIVSALKTALEKRAASLPA